MEMSLIDVVKSIKITEPIPATKLISVNTLNKKISFRLNEKRHRVQLYCKIWTATIKLLKSALSTKSLVEFPYFGYFTHLENSLIFSPNSYMASKLHITPPSLTDRPYNLDLAAIDCNLSIKNGETRLALNRIAESSIFIVHQSSKVSLNV
jgi:hypothetical protein